MTDPFAVFDDHDRTLWVDAVADAIEARDPDEPIVIKGGVSPSGVPHIGHANEILRGAFVAERLRERGHDVRQLFTTDDRDRLRAVPRTLATLDGEIVGLDAVDAGALGRNLGRPYTDVPDPFGCCDSYGAHFTQILESIADRLGVSMEVVSNTASYEAGDFDDAIETVLGDLDRARSVLGEYQDGVGEETIPFQALCESCGILTDGIESVDLDAGTVTYTCEDLTVGDQTIEGCGHEGQAALSEGKLPWRFEWPAQWALYGVDFEPFGKDHAEGSWPSGEHVARDVFDIDPPVPMVYEWFTVDGDALSSSSGTIVTVDEVLDVLEPEVVRYFFLKDPTTQRDFSIAHLDQLVDEFDRLEAVYHGAAEADEDERAYAEQAYPLLVEDPDAERVRIPYTFAAVLAMTDDPELRETIARREGHIPDDASDAVVDDALARVERAREWTRRTDNAFNYDLKRQERPAVDLTPGVGAALDRIADAVASEADGEHIQEEIYEAADSEGVEVQAVFEAAYRLLFDKPEGPRLGPFLAALDRAFVVDRLRREA
ncbi:lysine--tRNA ligase [Halococcoides cellulosivorans]|uniref:Lysine--tRNA ligase n=1 Tax=Halococcoides cellulosivorans TaxID=1679096 RepID=A0A2R4X1S9_9EURY|nr:lysine--tRNA ligase [Halococcoides cellulosivorans]AWB27756.1 lysine--tRNA ligase [Halococcoides cellulosivorans]